MRTQNWSWNREVKSKNTNQQVSSQFSPTKVSHFSHLKPNKKSVFPLISLGSVNIFTFSDRLDAYEKKSVKSGQLHERSTWIRRKKLKLALNHQNDLIFQPVHKHIGAPSRKCQKRWCCGWWKECETIFFLQKLIIFEKNKKTRKVKKKVRESS